MPVLGLLLAILPGWARASETVTHPFVGVTHIARSETSPRPLKMHIVDIDLAAPGIAFKVTPHGGARATIKETTLQFLAEQQAQIAINAHFFEPWPPPDPDPGAADLVGIAASDGDVYSPFDGHPPKQYAIRPNAPGLNLDRNNHASIVHRNMSDPTGHAVAEPVALYNTVAGNEQIVSNGAVTAAEGDWNNQLNPRTAIALAPNNHLILFTVDGRQPGASEGMKVGEMANLLLRDYGVTEAIALDGGGSTTLVVADPTPHVVNVPVGVNDVPGTLRAVGSNLAVFAQAPDTATTAHHPSSARHPSSRAPSSSPTHTASPGAASNQSGSQAAWVVAGALAFAAAVVAVRVWRRRH